MDTSLVHETAAARHKPERPLVTSGNVTTANTRLIDALENPLIELIIPAGFDPVTAKRSESSLKAELPQNLGKLVARISGCDFFPSQKVHQMDLRISSLILCS